MGADLYINSLFSKSMAEWRPKFDDAVQKREEAKKTRNYILADQWQKECSEAYNKMYETGYFRDSYNPSSVCWVMKISWWNDVIPLLNEGNLSVENTKKFLETIKSREITFEKVSEYWKENLSESKDDVQKWYDYFIEKRTKLIQFLEQAIELNEHIDCSL